MSNQHRSSRPLRRYIAQADLSGRVHWCTHRQWLMSPVKSGIPRLQHPWFRSPPATNRRSGAVAQRQTPMSFTPACAQQALSLLVLDVTNLVEHTEHLPSSPHTLRCSTKPAMFLHSEIIPTPVVTLPATKHPVPVSRHAILRDMPMIALQQLQSPLESLLSYLDHPPLILIRNHRLSHFGLCSSPTFTRP